MSLLHTLHCKVYWIEPYHSDRQSITNSASDAETFKCNLNISLKHRGSQDRGRCIRLLDTT